MAQAVKFPEGQRFILKSLSWEEICRAQPELRQGEETGFSCGENEEILALNGKEGWIGNGVIPADKVPGCTFLFMRMGPCTVSYTVTDVRYRDPLRPSYTDTLQYSAEFTARITEPGRFGSILLQNGMAGDEAFYMKKLRILAAGSVREAVLEHIARDPRMREAAELQGKLLERMDGYFGPLGMKIEAVGLPRAKLSGSLLSYLKRRGKNESPDADVIGWANGEKAPARWFGLSGKEDRYVRLDLKPVQEALYMISPRQPGAVLLPGEDLGKIRACGVWITESGVPVSAAFEDFRIAVPEGEEPRLCPVRGRAELVSESGMKELLRTLTAKEGAPDEPEKIRAALAERIREGLGAALKRTREQLPDERYRALTKALCSAEENGEAAEPLREALSAELKKYGFRIEKLELRLEAGPLLSEELKAGGEAPEADAAGLEAAVKKLSEDAKAPGESRRALEKLAENGSEAAAWYLAQACRDSDPALYHAYLLKTVQRKEKRKYPAAAPLGRTYQEGIGCERNELEALWWYADAVSRKEEGGAEGLRELYRGSGMIRCLLYCVRRSEKLDGFPLGELLRELEESRGAKEAEQELYALMDRHRQAQDAFPGIDQRYHKAYAWYHYTSERRVARRIEEGRKKRAQEKEAKRKAAIQESIRREEEARKREEAERAAKDKWKFWKRKG